VTDDRFVSQREFAKHVGRSHVWINRLVKEGRLPSDARGRVPLEAGLRIFATLSQTVDPGVVAHNEKQRGAAKKKTRKPTNPENRVRKAPAPEPPRAVEPEPPRAVEPEPAPAAPSQHDAVIGRAVNVAEQYSRAKAAKETFAAKKMELEYKRAAGELIHVDEVRDDATKTAAEVRERLFGVPSRVAGMCEGKGAREIERILDDAINEALDALRRSRFVDV